jgi:hypothetical protein
MYILYIAGWSSWSARLAHNQEVVGSNPTPATMDRNETTYNSTLEYYARTYGKREDESWDDFSRRLDRILINKSRERRRHSICRARFIS